MTNPGNRTMNDSSNDKGDSSNIENVRAHIIRLAKEIEEFSKNPGLPPATFFEEFLKRVVEAVGARAGAVWMLNGQNQLGLFKEVGLNNIGFNENPQARVLNQKLLIDVMQNGQASTYSDEKGGDIQLPTGDLLILAALQREKQCVGVVEIFQRPDTPPQARPGYLQFVEQMCGYACRYLDVHETAKSAPSSAEADSELTSNLEQFLLQLHRSLDVKEVVNTAANDGRLLLKCDRLSVAVQRGKKSKIEGISGQESVNQRANLVRTMAALTTKVVAMREPLIYTGRVENLAPQIEEPLADYIQESGSRMVMVFPLLQPEPLVKKDDQVTGRPRKKKPPKVIGGLIVEQISESQPKAGLQDRSELLADHIAEGLANSRAHQGLFLLPMWQFLGRVLGWFEGRNLLKAAAAVVLAIVVGLAFAYVPYDYRVEGEGRLMPIIQQDVFCPWDGEVTEVFVEHKQRVEKGQKLLQMTNDELRAQLLATRNELSEKRQLLHALLAEFDEAAKQAAKEDEIRIQGEIVKTRIEIEGAEEQVGVLQQRQDSLTVKAPISGVIATFEIEQQLQNRPVRRGEVLLEIKDDTGPWRLELEVEEHRMGHILRAQKKEDTEHLRVEFVLATSAETTYPGKLESMSTRTNSAEETGSIVVVYASIDSDQLPARRIGADVRTKIYCGKRALGYVLFGDVVEFVQKYFWL